MDKDGVVEMPAIKMKSAPKPASSAVLSTSGQAAKAIISLESRGFCNDFSLEREQLRCLQNGKRIAPNDFDILEIHLCGEAGKPDGLSLVYGIALLDPPLKGILLVHVRDDAASMSIYPLQ